MTENIVGACTSVDHLPSSWQGGVLCFAIGYAFGCIWCFYRLSGALRRPGVKFNASRHRGFPCCMFLNCHLAICVSRILCVEAKVMRVSVPSK